MDPGYSMQFTAEQAIAFLALCFLVGPALIYVGRLSGRVTSLEAAREKAEEDQKERDRIRELLVERFVRTELETKGLKENQTVLFSKLDEIRRELRDLPGKLAGERGAC